ncbi:MAG: PGPGW domain-containing protein [Arachnia sp.]
MGKGPKRRKFSAAWWKRLAAEIVGIILLVVGVLALFLPGPGLLTIFAGLVLLSTSFDWADHLMHPIKERAFRLARDGVQTWPRIAMSALGALALIATGLLWGLDFAVPGWWPIADRWWLLGGWATGITMMVSGVFALGLIVYSVVEFRIRGRLLPSEYRYETQ